MIVDILESSGVDFILSLPCNILSGIIAEIENRSIKHIPVCREEEGVGIAAGVALAGHRSMLLMQNSGLGNSVNAIMSLTSLYRLPLFIMMSHRGETGEKISAQIPMGKTAPLLFDAMNIDYLSVSSKIQLSELESFMKKTFTTFKINAAFLSRNLWNETS